MSVSEILIHLWLFYLRRLKPITLHLLNLILEELLKMAAVYERFEDEPFEVQSLQSSGLHYTHISSI